MRTLIACLIPFLLAADPVIVIQPDGTAWYSPGDGSPTVVVQRVVMPPGDAPQPPTDPDEPDEPDPPTSLTESVKARAVAIGDPDGALLLAAAYDLLADQFEAGKGGATNTERGQTVKVVTDDSLAFLKRYVPAKHSEWVAFDVWLSGQVGPRVASGALATAADWAAMLREVQAGLEAAAKAGGVTWQGDLSAAATDESLGDDLKPILRLLLRQLLERLLDRFFNDVLGPAQSSTRILPATFAERAQLRDDILSRLERQYGIAR